MSLMFFITDRLGCSSKTHQGNIYRSFFLVAILGSFLSPIAVATEQLTQKPITSIQDINQQAPGLYLDNMLQLLKPVHSQLGITVWDMTTQQTVFEYNNQSLMQPASIQKLLTALASTKQLGKEFSYQTQITTLANRPLAAD